MKFIHAVLLISFLYCSSVLAKPAEFIVTKLVAGDIHTYDTKHLERLVTILKSAGINTVTLPIAWSVIEPEPEQYDFTRYSVALDLLTQQGFNLLLILDSSRRKLVSQDNQFTTDIAAPPWLFQRYPDAVTIDFFGASGFGNQDQSRNFDYPYDLDYHDTQHLAAIERFYNKAITFFRQRYGDKF